jgi:hypothetical protein
MKDHIVIHHSLTRDGSTVNWQAIRRFHTTHPKYLWDDIGYHFGIELVRDEHEILVGRMPNKPGAHCREMGMNTRAYGICVVGNFDEEAPPAAAIDKLVGLCRYLMLVDHIPALNVLGHREVGMFAGFNWQEGEYKSCPGRQFDVGAIRGYLG